MVELLYFILICGIFSINFGLIFGWNQIFKKIKLENKGE